MITKKLRVIRWLMVAIVKEIPPMITTAKDSNGIYNTLCVCENPQSS